MSTIETPAPGMTTLPGAGANWKQYGACAEVDPDLWFPKPNESTASARAVCLQCEVRLVCLEYALEHGERGIWGGTDEGQRKAIRKARDTRRRAEAVPPAAA